MVELLKVENLTKKFGPLTAVDNISFKVDKGDVLGFLGPNGAGKSTTMKMITGFLTPSSGTAIVCGKDILDEPIKVKKKYWVFARRSSFIWRYDGWFILKFCG